MSEIRRAKLKEWFATRPIPPKEKSYISQLIGGKASFGEKAARRLERDYFMGDKYLDDESLISPSSYMQIDSPQTESENSNDKDSAVLLKFPKTTPDTIYAPDSYLIRQYASGGSMGNGLTLPDQPGVIENWSVSREWLHKNVRNITGVQNLCIVTGFGPSMQPMYNPGDPLLVDTGVKQVIADGVYFFRVGENGYIKQLQMIPTETGVKYIAKSKNPDFDPFDITETMDFEILGKVVRVWCGTDF